MHPRKKTIKELGKERFLILKDMEQVMTCISNRIPSRQFL